MKTIKIIFLTTISFILTTGMSYADDKKNTYTKEYHENYNLNEQSVFNLKNKFGSVNIHNWDKQELQVDVVITVKHANAEKAAKLLDEINVSFKQEGDEIFAETSIEIENSNKVVFFGSSKNNYDYSIDYEVKMPHSLNLNLLNKYGKTFIEKLTSKSTIEVKYGSLKANELLFDNVKPFSKIYVSYGAANIESCNWANVFVKYSDFNLTKTSALILVTKYSEIEIEQASSLIVDSKYDEYKIAYVKNFIIDGKYSDYTIGGLGKILEMDVQYGNLDVKAVAVDFEKISLTAKYFDADLAMDRSSNYIIDIGADYADVDFPSNAALSKNEGIYRGYVGSKNANSKVYIRTKYGDIDLN